MNDQRRKELIAAYKNRKPEMGIIFFRSQATGEEFYGAANDLKAVTNGVRVRLCGGQHPNKRLQALWQENGVDGFEIGVLEKHEYDEPTENQDRALEDLLEACLAEHPQAKRIWK